MKRKKGRYLNEEQTKHNKKQTALLTYSLLLQIPTGLSDTYASRMCAGSEDPHTHTACTHVAIFPLAHHLSMCISCKHSSEFYASDSVERYTKTTSFVSFHSHPLTAASSLCQ